jgi:hypothetical protein
MVFSERSNVWLRYFLRCFSMHIYLIKGHIVYLSSYNNIGVFTFNQ